VAATAVLVVKLPVLWAELSNGGGG